MALLRDAGGRHGDPLMMMAAIAFDRDGGSAYPPVWFERSAVRLLFAERHEVLPSAVMWAAFTGDRHPVSAQRAVPGSRTTHGHGLSGHIDTSD